jgi:hypothetical protein
MIVGIFVESSGPDAIASCLATAVTPVQLQELAKGDGSETQADMPASAAASVTSAAAAAAAAAASAATSEETRRGPVSGGCDEVGYELLVRFLADLEDCCEHLKAQHVADREEYVSGCVHVRM